MKKALIAVILAVLLLSASAYGACNLLYSTSPSPSPSPSISPTSSPTPTPASSSPSPTAAPTSSPTPSIAPQKTITITDATGAQVTVNLPVHRIVSLTSSLTELVCALGSEDQIVGRDSYSTFPSSILAQPVVGESSSEPNMENLLELQPDIVFADTMLTYNPDAQTQLKNAGIPVVIELMNNATCLKTCIHDLGVILGKEENAAAMTNYITSYETLVNERLANITAAEKPKVYIEWGTWQSYAEGSGADGNIVAAGGSNVASGSSTSYPTVSPESIVEKDPDVILLLQFGTAPNMTSFKSTVDGLYSREVLSGTTAIKEKRVYAYSPDIFEGIRYPVGLLYFAKWFYPAQFADIDPATVHQDLIEKFFDLPLDGVFTYPETLTIVDGTDTTLTLNLPVNRIVSLNSGMTEILCALGCEDQLVGRDESSTLPPSVLKVPTAGESSYYPNLEVLLELEPDLVVADSSFTYVPEGMSRLQAAGIPVFISDTSDPQASAHSNSTTIDFTCNLVYKLSMIVQKQDRANDYITYAQHYNNLVKERIANLTKDQRPNVMLEWYAPYNTFVTPSLDQAGGINIAENQSIYAPVLSPEFVVEQNPSVIIRLILSLNHDEVDFKAAQTEILNRPELSGVAAIKNDGVFICDYAIRDGIHGLVGYLYWAKWCQPDLFADINPAAVSAEIDQTFFGETISGVFAYP